MSAPRWSVHKMISKVKAHYVAVLAAAWSGEPVSRKELKAAQEARKAMEKSGLWGPS